MRAVPSHPMGHFPWESHHYGQARLSRSFGVNSFPIFTMLKKKNCIAVMLTIFEVAHIVRIVSKKKRKKMYEEIH